MYKLSESALDSRARRAAYKIGLVARKSRRLESYDNQGGYMIVDPSTRGCVAGWGYDMTAEDVIEYCSN